MIEKKSELRQVSLLKTEGEWAFIKEKINQLGKKNLNLFIRSEARKLGEAYQQCPGAISKASGKRVRKRPSVPIDSYNKIKQISDQMGIPVSSVVDYLILMPLLTRP